MKVIKQELIDIARSYVGTKETGSNINIFAKKLDKAKYYVPQKKQGVPYCMVFLDCCTWEYFKEDNDKAHKWLYQPLYNDLSAGAKYQQKYFMDNHRYSKIPNIGDWAFIGYPAKHGCLVINVGIKTITTIDGNHSNKVDIVVRNRSDFHGFGHPEYYDEGEVCMIAMKVIRKGDECGEVLTLQSLLKCKGYKGSNGKVLALDGKFGTNTESALKDYQKKNELTVDGIAGQSTWNTILKGE